MGGTKTGKTVNLYVNIHDSSLHLAVQTIPAHYDKSAMMAKAAELMNLPLVQEWAKKMNVTHVDIFTYDVKAHDVATNVPIDELQGKNPVSGGPVMPSNDSDYWDEQKAFFKRYE